MRAGVQALSLLAVPNHVHTLQVLGDGPSSLVDLRRALGSPPQTTMRGHLRTLTQLGLIERHRSSRVPSSASYEATSSGRDFLGLAAVVQNWLNMGPEGPLQLGSPASKSVIKSLVDGWSSALLRALAARPLALTELDRLITTLNYPSLERRLGGMRLAGLIEPCPESRRGRPYAVTSWLRLAIGPLAAAAHWERKQLPQIAAPPTRLDYETMFLLAAPLVQLPDKPSGTCRLVIELQTSTASEFVGVELSVDQGRINSCTTRWSGPPESAACGSSSAWLRALVLNDPIGIEFSGDTSMGESFVEGLHRRLFRSPETRRLLPRR